MKKKSFIMTLGVGMLVLALGVTSCSSKKKPVTPTSNSEPTSVATSEPTSTVKPSSVVTSDAPTSDTTSVSDPTTSVLPDTSSTIDVPTSDTPVTSNATVKIGEGEAVALTEMEKDPDVSNMLKQYSITGVSVTAGDKLVFTVDGTVVAPGASGEGNNAKADASGLTIVSTAASVDIYLKAYDDGGYDVWVTGYVQGDIPDIPVTGNATVKIGETAAVALTEMDPDPTDTNMKKQYSITGVSVTAGDKLVFTVDGTAVTPGASGEGNNAKADASGLTIVSTAASVDIYLKAYKDGGYDVWVTGYVQGDTPITAGYEVKVNGTKATVGELTAGPTDAYACTVDLKKDDVLVLTKDGVSLKVGETTSTEFKCTVAGVHKVYVNDKGQVWVTEPLAPVETKYTVTVNGTAKTITLIPDSENHAQFKLTLTKGDKVVVYGDGTALTGGAYTGTEYTVKATGEHTFYVNKDDVVYLNAPALDPSDVTSITVTVNFSKISEGNERYAAYLFGGSNNEWVSLEVNNGVATLTLTEAQAAKYTNVIFCRMNGAAAQNNWNNKWDQTADLTLEGNDGKTFTASSKSNGKINGSWN